MTIRKYYVNENYFDNWSSNMAYILGFLTADGYNSNKGIEITVNIKDIAVLEFIRNEIGSTQPIEIFKKYNKKTKKYYEHSRLKIFSVKLSKKLAKDFGIIKAKTGKEKICFNIPEDYKFDYIRGLLDGDGRIEYFEGIRSFICSASKDFLIQVQQLCGGIGRIRPHSGIFELDFRRDDTIKLCTLIYKNIDCFKLIRKFEIFNNYSADNNRIYYSDEDESYLLLNKDLLSREEIAKKLNRTVRSVTAKICRINKIIKEDKCHLNKLAS